MIKMHRAHTHLCIKHEQLRNKQKKHFSENDIGLTVQDFMFKMLRMQIHLYIQQDAQTSKKHNARQTNEAGA